MSTATGKLIPGLLADFESRGLVHAVSDPDLGRRLDTEPITVYCGFDPTADSLHAGHLIPLLTLARFQRHGHIPIVVMGGGTGMIGDPSGKSAERNLLDLATLESNLEAERPQFARILDFDRPGNPAIMVNNHDWLSDLDLIGFLRDVGKHLPMSIMLSRESVRRRLESDAGLSFTEFTYQALQAYDFYHLYQHHNCRLQVGGSDQYGNILTGVDYIRRMTGADDRATALVYPLLTTASGEKMGQTARGAIWLDPARTSPFEWYQYWFNADDADVIAFLRTLTLLELEEIAAIEARAQADPAARIGQRALAAELTRMIHGPEAAEAAERDSRQAFTASADPAALSGDVPSAEVTHADLDEGLSLTRILVKTGLAASNGEAKRLVRQGGVSIDGRRVEPTKRTIDKSVFAGSDAILLAAGPRRRAILRVVN
ncbi:MAG: tyrosine--tRNA ligase [Chloroflexota bacterium]|nr:tyrosine--tRNA ligase [Chloroflexota bacterium]MDP6508480.1 tyrosine--tRNA ligase [Chloroflexota bacterium]MDP6757569.1 tyrosine--tRNA ligase [Chloroflexota bacterium]